MNSSRCIDTRFIVPAWILPLVLATLVLAPSARASDYYYYTNNAVQDFYNGFSWTNCPPNQFIPACLPLLPLSGDNVFFYDGVGSYSSYSVVFPLAASTTTGDVTVAGVDAIFNLNGGTYSIDDSIAPFANLDVGLASPYSASTNTTLTLLNGTLDVGAGSDYGVTTIGDQAGYSGRLGVVGANLFSEELWVGEAGDGTLTVTNGGHVSSELSFIAADASSTGVATVSGSGSSWTSTDKLYVGGSGLGSGGTGTLTVSDNADVDVGGLLKVWDNGAVVQNTGGLIKAQQLDIVGGGVASFEDSIALKPSSTPTQGLWLTQSSNTATVDGAGSTLSTNASLSVGTGGTAVLTLRNGGMATAAGDLTVGAQGTVDTTSDGVADADTLSIVGGGDVSSLAGFVGVPFAATAAGTMSVRSSASVDGSGSTWDTNGGDLRVGVFTAGDLIISDGGEVHNGASFVGATNGSAGSTVTVGTGAGNSQWINDGDLTIGGAGGGSLLRVDINGTVTANNAALLVGANGYVDSFALDNDGTIYAETISISDGGVVNSRLAVVGVNSTDPVEHRTTARSAATVDGAGSIWDNIDGPFLVGAGAKGTLTISNGAAVTSERVRISRSSTATGSAATVDGSGSSWIISGDLDVGQFAMGTLTISNGGEVSNLDGFISKFSDENGSSVLVGGGSSTSSWTNTNSLYVGGVESFAADGSGALTVTTNGTVTAANLLKVWDQGTVDTTGGGRIGADSVVIAGGGDLASTSVVIGGGTGLPGLAGEVLVSSSAQVGGSGSTWNTNGNNLTVGLTAAGSLSISGGGQVTNSQGFITGNALGAGSTVTVSGSGSRWKNTNGLYVGGNASFGFGAGSLTVNNSGFVTVSTAPLQIWGSGSVDTTGGGFIETETLSINDGGLLSSLTGAVGTLSAPSRLGQVKVVSSATVEGVGSAWDMGTGDFTVGLASTGTLSITDGGTVSNGAGFIGTSFGSNNSAVTVGGGTADSSWINTDGLTVGNALGSAAGSLTVTSNGLVAVSNAPMTVQAAGTVVDTTGGGIIQTDTLSIHDGGSVNGIQARIGTTSTLSDAGNFTVFSATTVAGSGSTWDSSVMSLGLTSGSTGSLTIQDGGQVDAFISVIGTASGSSGTVTVQDSGSMLAGAVITVGANGSGSLMVESGADVSVMGDVRLGAALTGTGSVTVTDAGSTLTSSDIYVGGTDSSSRGTADLTVSNSGLVDVGNTLTVWDTGTVNLAGGTIDTNSLNNEGAVTVSSDSSISGDVSNTTTGQIAITNNTTLTLAGNLVHNGTAMDVEVGSTIIYQGDVSGASDFTGAGGHIFQGSFNPGNSPGAVSIEGDVQFDAGHVLTMELAGVTPGVDYDTLWIGAGNPFGVAVLGGTLEIDLLNGFQGSLGDSFDLITAAILVGTFDTVLLPTVNDYTYQLDYLIDAIGNDDIVRLSVVSAVPVPPAVWLFGSGLIGMVAVGRRRRDNTGVLA